MRNFNLRNLSLIAAVAIFALTASIPANAQSAWTKMKIQVLQQACRGGDQNSCQQLAKLTQKASQTQPGTQGQPQGAQLGQPQSGLASGGQPQPGQFHDESGPIHPPHGTKVEETVMAPLAQGAKFFVSPHGVHIATLENSGSRAVMYYDGVPGPKFDEVIGGGTVTGELGVAFSPDGKRFAYCGLVGGQMAVMVDGKELQRSSESNLGQLNNNSCQLGFTSNSQHVFLRTQIATSQSTGGSFTRFFFDGKPASLPSAGQINPAFSPDGNHYAYVAVDPADQHKWGLVIDGKMAPYRGGDPQWSADSQHLYTTILMPAPGGRGEVMEAMLDGKTFIRADHIVLHVAPAGNLVVAEVNAASNMPQPLKFLVVDGKKVPGTEIVNQRGANIDQVTISPDGRHFAARFTSTQNRQYVFLDGKRGQEYQSVDHIAFTSDSSNVTYTAFANGKPYSIIGDQESDTCLAEQSGPVIDTHGALMIAPMGGRAGTICGNTGGAPTIYMDGKTLRFPNGALAGTDLRFSPDGQHYAYSAGFQGGGLRLIVDGAVQMNSNLGSAGHQRARFVFSPDSQHIAVDCLPPNPTGEYASGVCLDGKYIPGLANPGILRIEFTADSKHLAWAQPVTGRQGFRLFVDGRAVAEADEAMAATSREAWWDMAPDGSLSVLAQDENNLKRITITPSPETSLATLGGGGSMLARRDDAEGNHQQ